MERTPEHLTLLRNLCNGQPLAVLATAADPGPYTSLVAIAFDRDLRRLYFATQQDTRKGQNLRKNPMVSLLLDNRSNTVADFTRAAAATVLGKAEAATGEERNAGQTVYLARHPDLSGFVNSPGCVLFQVIIERIVLVTHFQQTVAFDFTEPGTT